MPRLAPVAVGAICLFMAGLIAPVSTTVAQAGPTLEPRSAPGTTTYAVIRVINVGQRPTGVAIDDSDDTVYVTNTSFSDNVSVINGRTGVVTGAPISVGDTPLSVAVNQRDDTVYVANSSSGNVSVIDGRTGAVARTITIGNSPSAVAVNQRDDTVYVANSGNGDLSVIDGRMGAVAGTIPVVNGSSAVAVNQRDDTVYVPNSSNPFDGFLSVINGRTRFVADTIPVGRSPVAVAVNQRDDTVYVANLFFSPSVTVINGRTGFVASSIPLASFPYGVAVDQVDDTVYVTYQNANAVQVINGRSGALTDETITVGQTPLGVAVDDSGLVYVANSDSNNVSVIGRASPFLPTPSGVPGSVVEVNVVVPQVTYDVDDATVTSVSFGVTPASGLAAGIGNQWTVTAPAGTPGSSVPVTVTFRGGLTASAGTFTYSATPPSPPLGVTAVAGNAQAQVTWNAPANPGSSPVTNYEVRSTPAGGTCLTTVLTCTVTGLTNGTAYTFETRALNSGGWGPWSTPSGTVTPSDPTPPPSPPPPPAFPPSAPQGVTAVAGNAQAQVTWTAPANPGSSPVTNYEVRSTPAGGTCLTTVLTCTVTGLTNGTAYTFEARALNGAGWGPWSTPSNAVTPSDPTPPPPPPPSITITGSRGTGAERQVVFVTGTSTGPGGEQVRAHVKLRGQAAYRPGRFVDVSTEGRFDWQRTTGKKTYVYFTGGGVQSNRVIIPAARR